MKYYFIVKHGGKNDQYVTWLSPSVPLVERDKWHLGFDFSPKCLCDEETALNFMKLADKKNYKLYEVVFDPTEKRMVS